METKTAECWASVDLKVGLASYRCSAFGWQTSRSKARLHRGDEKMDVHVPRCRGTLTLHTDTSHSCSEITCVKTGSPEQALSTHSCILLCNQDNCARCAGEPAGQVGNRGYWLN